MYFYCDIFNYMFLPVIRPSSGWHFCYNNIWAARKVSDLWPGKIHSHAWRSATLIPFEVVCLWLNTLLPAVPPLFEAFLECLFANGVQLGRRFPYDVVSWLKSSPFHLRFQVGEQPIIARSHVGRVGSLSNHRNVVFDQESLNQLRGMSWCVVMMQLPCSRCPQVRSLAPHSITKTTKDFQVVFFVNVLPLWYVFVMHNPTGVKEYGRCSARPLPFWPRGYWMFPLWRLRLGFRVVTQTHDSSPVVTMFRNSGVAVCGVQHVLSEFQTELLLLHR